MAANREHIDLFSEELEQAIEIIAALPGAGTVYAQSPVPGVRRVYLINLIDLTGNGKSLCTCDAHTEPFVHQQQVSVRSLRQLNRLTLSGI